MKEWHNFLVGDVGVVVHNNYLNFALKFVNDIKKFDNAVNNPDNIQKVWRVMRKTQSTNTPIKPKSPHGLTTSKTPYTIEGHVLRGSDQNTITPYISTFTNKDKALQRALSDGNLKVVEIDLSQIEFRSKLFDLSNETVRNTLLQSNRARNYASSSSEFLIVIDQIPTSAFQVIN